MFDNSFGNPKVQGIKEIVLPEPVAGLENQQRSKYLAQSN